MAKLILVSGDEPKEFELKQFNSLGRHPDSSIQILDRIISKEHAQVIRNDQNRFVLRDLGSLNGTYVGDERVKDHILRDGDEITLGSTRLVYREATPEEQSLNRVTIAPGSTQSHIRQRITAEGVDKFLSEQEIRDESQLRRDYERLRIANELARAVANEFDLDLLLQKILDQAFELLAADRGVILLMNEAGEPVPQVARDRRGGPTDEIILSNSILNEVVREKQAVLSSDASVDSRFSGAHSIIMQGIRSTMCVPLLHGGELLGIMHLDSQIATNAFNEKDLQLFTGIAAQAAIAIKNARLASKIEWEARTRAQFQRFFSPAIVQQMVQGKLKLDGVGEMREVTVLFADIRGFTPMTEDADAHAIVSLLNDYFEVMVDVLFRHDGTLDKYVGDEIMALFGVPVAQSDAAINAVACALDMQAALTEFNQTRVAEGQSPIKVGIGINTGQCVYGAIGSSKTVQYTVIGDAVNTASRLCSVAKGDEIICSEATYRHVERAIQGVALPKVRVKGKNEELSIYRMTGFKDPSYRKQAQPPGT